MINGKGIFIWKSKHCEDGSISAIVQACKSLGLNWVTLKIGDAASQFFASFSDMPAAVAAFRAAGISVWGWHYVYGGVHLKKDGTPYNYGPTPEQEASFALKQVHELQLAGYIVDAESQYKVFGQVERAKRFVAGIARIDVPVALCSYRFPSLHRELPWAEFLSIADLHMPQVYWGKGNAVSDLDRSMQQLSALKALPFAPVGRAYIGDGYASPGPDRDEIRAFLLRAVERGCLAASFWSLDHLYLHDGGPERGGAIAAFVWAGEVPPPPPDPESRPTVIGKIRVLAGALNVRAGPGAQYRDVGDLVHDTEWFVISSSGDWAQIGHGVWCKTGPGLAEWLTRYTLHE